MFYEKRMGHEVEADGLGDEWKVCIVKFCYIFGIQSLVLIILLCAQEDI